MTAFRTLFALSVATLATACAGPGAMNAAPAAHDMANMAAPSSTAAMEPRMMAMQEMHQRMMGAKTPEERQALMAEHMKAMQGGMAMMKEMHGMDGMQGMKGMAMPGGMQGMGSMSDGSAMQAEMAKRQQTMAEHMAMMQMMMTMMADRMPPAPAPR